MEGLKIRVRPRRLFSWGHLSTSLIRYVISCREPQRPRSDILACIHSNRGRHFPLCSGGGKKERVALTIKGERHYFKR